MAFAKYVEGLVKAYANRGEYSQFEVHQFPDVSDEECMKTLQDHGLKKTSCLMKGVPQVHFVEWDYDSEYYEKHLQEIVSVARQRIADEHFQQRKRQSKK